MSDRSRRNSSSKVPPAVVKYLQQRVQIILLLQPAVFSHCFIHFTVMLAGVAVGGKAEQPDKVGDIK
jgi:hypothetical protein